MSEGGGRRPGRVWVGGKQTILKTGSGGQPNGACEPWATGEGGEEAEVYPGNMGAGAVRSGWNAGWKGGHWWLCGICTRVCLQGWAWKSGEAGAEVQPPAGCGLLNRCLRCGIHEFLVDVATVAHLYERN